MPRACFIRRQLASVFALLPLVRRAGSGHLHSGHLGSGRRSLATRSWLALLAAATLAASAAAGEPASPEPLTPDLLDFFETKVRPVLSARCFECHTGDEPKGGLRLDSYQSLLAGGDTGPAIVPGQPDESLLIEAVRYGGVYQMPPTGKLPDDELAALVQWVRLGAVWAAQDEEPSPPPAESGGPLFTEEQRTFWAFVPPRPSPLPSVRQPGWCQSPLDFFVLADLEKHGLAPAPPADKRTLIRRATFDLIGLPPQESDVEAFLADESPGAFDRVVDRLLSSPHYGERWARHWLDVARYADSNGLDENLAYVQAYRYRDYVVAALNADMPYDQFVLEQLAGDLLEPTGDPAVDYRRQIATGFLTLGAKMLAEDDPVKMEMDIIDEQVDTMGGALLGLTLGCARCHDHKFDPIPTADYYSLAGIFKSTRTMDDFKVVAHWHERPLAAPEEIARVEAHERQVGAKNKELDSIVQRANDDLVSAARRRCGDYLRAAARINAHPSPPDALMASREPPPGSVLLEAERFDRGNVKIDFETYGAGIGVIYNQGELPNRAEYDFELTAEGHYQVELRYAAAQARPVSLLLDGEPVHVEAASQSTGSWQATEQAWFAEAVCLITPGKHTLRLERNGPFPHFDRLALIPLDGGSSDAVDSPAVRYKTPTQLANELGLNPAFLSQWRSWLAGDSVQGLLAAATPAGGGPAALNFEAIEDLAGRFEAAERATRPSESEPAGSPPPALEDPLLESARQVLDDPHGPVRLPADPMVYYPAEARAQIDSLRGELTALAQQAPAELPKAMAVEAGEPVNLRIHVRGSHLALGAEVPRRFPRILAGEDQLPLPADRSGRLELARWITRREHPLTARVIVNRVWRWHFGQALVRTPDNFGRLGDRPANQALLDWLALELVDQGWSIKSLHRQIMRSATYQMSSTCNAAAAQADPDNRLHWRMNRRRLEAEAIRDSILAVAGQLDLEMEGSLLNAKPREYVAGTASVNLAQYDSYRRSIYLPVIRSALYEVFQAFDFAEPSVLNGDRASTTVAPQALFMMNSRLVGEATLELARALEARTDMDEAGRIDRLYRRALSRPARAEEIQSGLAFLDRVAAAIEVQDTAERRLRAWQSLCRVVISTNEFIHVE